MYGILFYLASIRATFLRKLRLKFPFYEVISLQIRIFTGIIIL